MIQRICFRILILTVIFMLMVTPTGVLAEPMADWSDNFDAYGQGISLHGMGGWKGWSNDAAATAYTSGGTATAAKIIGSSDLVHEFSGYTSGTWYFIAWQYIPTDFSGRSYFILLNQYSDSGNPLNWSTQIYFDSVQNTIVFEDGITDALALVKGDWVKLCIAINLDSDTQTIYYDDKLLANKSWTNGLGWAGIANIAAVDLFGNGASPVYYDNMSLSQGGCTAAQPTRVSLHSLTAGAAASPVWQIAFLLILGLAAAGFILDLRKRARHPGR